MQQLVFQFHFRSWQIEKGWGWRVRGGWRGEGKGGGVGGESSDASELKLVVYNLENDGTENIFQGPGSLMNV